MYTQLHEINFFKHTRNYEIDRFYLSKDDAIRVFRITY